MGAPPCNLFALMCPCCRRDLKGRDESAGGRVHVDADLPAVLGVELLDGVVDVPNGVILPAVMIAHDAHDRDRLLIAVLRKVGRCEGQGAGL